MEFNTIGYALGLVVSACVSSQAQKTHTEIVHVTGHFLRTTSLGSYEIHVRTIRKGGSFTNLSAELIQKVQIRNLL